MPDWFIDREIIPLDDQIALVVCHRAMRKIVELCRDFSKKPGPILLTGETGVGKSLLARFIHANQDPYAPFISMTTAGLDSEVLSTMLFGDDRDGFAASCLASAAAGGTLVLEEMGDMPHEVQSRLMSVWDQQTGEGPSQWICTTNLPLRKLKTAGAMAPGFLRRLRHIHLPPLRRRKKDIPAIVAYFSRLKSSREAPIEDLEHLSKRLARHTFPGNVRELESIVSLEASGLNWKWRNNGL